MKKTAQHTTTQHFTEVKDIRDTVVLLEGGNACTILQITAVNFALLSPEEQDAKVLAYATLLNSLSFPIQIVIQSKQVQITPYLSSLANAASSTNNAKLASNIAQYKDFVENLIKMATVLDKTFFIVIPYSSLEGGIKSATIGPGKMEDFFVQAKASLSTKSDSLIAQLDRLALQAKILGKDELTHLFYGFYNDGQPLHLLDIQAMLAKIGGVK